jgi:hypothetical protein
MKESKKTKNLARIFIWYGVGSLLWFLIFGFLAATSDLQALIIGSYLTFTIGLFIGLIFKDQFLRRPWLILFVPILHLVVGSVVGFFD